MSQEEKWIKKGPTIDVQDREMMKQDRTSDHETTEQARNEI